MATACWSAQLHTAVAWPWHSQVGGERGGGRGSSVIYLSSAADRDGSDKCLPPTFPECRGEEFLIRCPAESANPDPRSSVAMLTEHLGSSQFTVARVQQAIAEAGAVSALLALLAVAAAAVVVDYAWMLYMRSRMPPGPLPWPIVGNTFSLPVNKPWIYFEALSKQYKAPLITFWVGR